RAGRAGHAGGGAPDGAGADGARRADAAGRRADVPCPNRAGRLIAAEKMVGLDTPRPTADDGRERYNGAAIALHWLTVLLVATNLLLGLSMVPLPISPRKLHWYLWHKSIGITIFLLTGARVAWRAARPH